MKRNYVEMKKLLMQNLCTSMINNFSHGEHMYIYNKQFFSGGTYVYLQSTIFLRGNWCTSIVNNFSHGELMYIYNKQFLSMKSRDKKGNKRCNTYTKSIYNNQGCSVPSIACRNSLLITTCIYIVEIYNHNISYYTFGPDLGENTRYSVIFHPSAHVHRYKYLHCIC